MNYLNTLFLFLLQIPVFTQAFAQYDTTVVKTYFTKITESDTANYAPSAIVENGNGYILIENVEFPGNKYVVLYNKLDSLGNKIKTTLFFDSLNLYQFSGGRVSVHTTKNTLTGRFVLYSEATNFDMIIFEMDMEGNLLWQQVFNNPYFESINQIIQTQDGGYLLVGGYSPIGISNYFWAVKLDENGETEWNKVLTELDTWSTALNVIEYDNFYLLGGGYLILTINL